MHHRYSKIKSHDIVTEIDSRSKEHSFRLNLFSKLFCSNIMIMLLVGVIGAQVLSNQDVYAQEFQEGEVSAPEDSGIEPQTSVIDEGGVSITDICGDNIDNDADGQMDDLDLEGCVPATGEVGAEDETTTATGEVGAEDGTTTATGEVGAEDETTTATGEEGEIVHLRCRDPEDVAPEDVAPEITDPSLLSSLDDDLLSPLDDDLDGIAEYEDNCPHIANLNQEDRDEDGKGDVCDNCPYNPNPDQEDTDGDSEGDACDQDALDVDYDGWKNTQDNCPYEFMSLKLMMIRMVKVMCAIPIILIMMTMG